MLLTVQNSDVRTVTGTPRNLPVDAARTRSVYFCGDKCCCYCGEKVGTYYATSL